MPINPQQKDFPVSPTVTEPLYTLPELDLLSIEDVNAVVGVRQANVNFPLPPPDFDLSKCLLKCGCPTSHQYWIRSTIDKWLKQVKFLSGPKKIKIRKKPEPN